MPTTAVRLPGSPTPEPSPSSTSRSTWARQRRPVRCGHPATSPPSKTWAPVHHHSRLRSPGPSASGTSPLKPELQTRRTCGSAHLPRALSPPAPRSPKTKPSPRPAPTRRGRPVHRPRGSRRAERPDLDSSTRDRRGTANRAEGGSSTCSGVAVLTRGHRACPCRVTLSRARREIRQAGPRREIRSHQHGSSPHRGARSTR